MASAPTVAELSALHTWETAEWKALEAHVPAIRKLHLRQLMQVQRSTVSSLSERWPRLDPSAHARLLPRGSIWLPRHLVSLVRLFEGCWALREAEGHVRGHHARLLTPARHRGDHEAPLRPVAPVGCAGFAVGTARGIGQSCQAQAPRALRRRPHKLGAFVSFAVLRDMLTDCRCSYSTDVLPAPILAQTWRKRHSCRRS